MINSAERQRGRTRIRALRLVQAGGLAIVCGFTSIACGSRSALPQLSNASIGDTTGLVARGEYIVRSVAVCGHCHAAQPQKDPDGPLSGGFAFRNWRVGTVRAANITPDVETGIGGWSDAELVGAIRNGQHQDGRVLAPIMPYEWFHEMSDRDALAVVRYLRSRPPVHHEVHNSMNFAYALAEAILLEPEENGNAVGAPARAVTADYGEYLANHVALCADCHTPRTGLLDRPDRERLFAGNAHPPKGFPANPANLTPDSTGIGLWSEDQFVGTLRTGVDPQGDSLHAFMPWRQYRLMTEGDLRAIYRYLRTVPPSQTER